MDDLMLAWAVAMERARGLCDRLAMRGAEIGLHDTTVWAPLHDGRVCPVVFELFTPTRSHALLVPPARCVGFDEARELLQSDMVESLADCVIRYGKVGARFDGSYLSEIIAIQTFRIARELHALARIYFPASAQPVNGHRAGKTPGRCGF